MQLRSNFLRCKFTATAIVLTVAIGVAAQQNDTQGVGGSTTSKVWEGATFSTEVLANGLRVSIFADQRMPVVTTQISYAIGSAHEDEGSRGLAHLLEHLMFGATRNYPERAVFNYVEEFGGSTGGQTTYDETLYHARTTPEGLPHVLEIYADRMVNLVIAETAFQREKKIVLEELRAKAQNDPISRLSMDALAIGMNDHPYSIWPGGTEEDLKSVTLETCVAFYQKYYGPRNTHLVIAGPVDALEAMKLVQSTFGVISKQVAVPPEPPQMSDWMFPEEVLLKDDIPPVEVAAMVFALPSAHSPDYDMISVLLELLNGFTGFEHEIVEKRRHALYAQTFDMQMKAGGVLAFGTVSLPYRRKDVAYRYLEQTLQKLGDFEWLDELSLERVKRSRLLREYQSRYYSSSIASRIAFAQDWKGDIHSAFNRETRLDSVTVEDLKRVYRTYILDARRLKAYIEPNHVPWYVRVFGRLYPLAERLGFGRLAI